MENGEWDYVYTRVIAPSSWLTGMAALFSSCAFFHLDTSPSIVLLLASGCLASLHIYLHTYIQPAGKDHSHDASTRHVVLLIQRTIHSIPPTFSLVESRTGSLERRDSVSSFRHSDPDCQLHSEPRQRTCIVDVYTNAHFTSLHMNR